MAVVLRQFPRSISGELNHAVWCSAAYIGLFTQQPRQLRYVYRKPSRLILRHWPLIADKARPQTALLVASAALVSPRVVRNSDFDARVIERQCRRASYHQKCTGIAGSRGVQFSSPTEEDVGD